MKTNNLTKQEAEWIEILPNTKLPSQIAEWKHPEYGVIKGSIVYGRRDSQWVLPADGTSAEIPLNEFTHVKFTPYEAPPEPQPADHTHLPWSALLSSPVYNTESKKSEIWIYSKLNNLIAITQGATIEEAEATANLITKAVNNNEKLVSLLVKILNDQKFLSGEHFNPIAKEIETTFKELEA